ncbi:MAG: apolipoprotein N-acyltransferase [Desulfovibrio sp.]|nr:apolipoprotein N-acyltransferase [Desulfovibrio sp.]
MPVICAVGACGFFLGLPNAFLHLPALALLHPFCLCLLAFCSPSDKSALFHGWLQGLAANAAGLYWMIHPMRDVAGIPLFVSLPLLLLLYAYLACYAALTVLGMRRFRPYGPALLGGLIFGGFEVLNSVIFTGFPWLTLTLAFSFTPALLQGASLAGGYALSAVYAGAACQCAAAFCTGKGLKALGGAALVLLLVGGLYLCGTKRLSPGSTSEDGQPILRFIMIQGNIDQGQKWNPSFQEATVGRYISLSRAALGADAQEDPKRRAELVVWPETAMPFHFSRHPDFAQRLRAFAAEERVHLAFGGIDLNMNDQASLRNCLYLMSPRGAILDRYDKMHLIPFGEYLPFTADIPFLRDLLQGMSFSAGTKAKPLIMELRAPDNTQARPGFPPALAKGFPGKNLSAADAKPGLGKEGGRGLDLSLGPLICYEVIFPYPAQEQVRQGAGIILDVSNDGWFRNSSAPRQHMGHAVIRAVEQARPVIRATNTGISALVDSRGRILTRSAGLFREESLKGEVGPETERTLYHRLHPAPEIGLAAFALFSLVLPGIGRKKSRRNREAASERAGRAAGRRESKPQPKEGADAPTA